MANPFKIASDFISHYEDESGKYYNPDRDTWTAYPDMLAGGLPTLGPGLTGKLGDIDIEVGKEYPSELITAEATKRSQGDYNLLSRNLGDIWGRYNPNQQAAVMSLLHNVGSGNLLKSKAFKNLKAGDIEGFIYEAFDPEVGFVKTEKGGEPSKGLIRRRTAERDLFLKDMAESAF